MAVCLTQSVIVLYIIFLCPLSSPYQTFIDSSSGSQLMSSSKVESLSSTVISPAALEKRLKEELVTLGLLDPPEVRY